MSQAKDYLHSTLCTDRDSEQDALIDEEQGFERRSIARSKSISTSNLSICFIIICVCVLLAVLMVAALSWHDRIIIIQTSGDLAINVNPSSKSLPQSTNDLSAQTRHPQSINDYSTKALPHEPANDHPITAAPLQPTNNLPVNSNSPYDRIFNRWRGYCESNNQVMARKDGFGVDGVPRRTWTLNDQTFNYIDRSKNPTIKHCEAPAQLLDSMKYGTRVDLQHLHKFIQAAPNTTSQTVNQYIDESIDAIYNQSVSEAQGEMHSSIFIPSKCTIDYRDSDSTCSILSKYSHFSVVGDSMSRHFVQSLFVVLTEDFRMGALPRLSPKSELYDSCQCDGMYSEHEVCRDFASDHIFHSRDLRSYGVCHNAIDATHRPTEFNHHPHPSQYTSNFKYLCSDDPRPRFIHLQGIWHYQGGVSVDQIPMQVIDRLIDPVMSTLKNASESCHRPFTYHVLYTAGHAQARALDANYPHQAREHMAINNAALKEHIENKWNHKFIDFWNLTRDAPSSDGAHHITEVNLLKVQYVLNYMDMITSAS